MQVILLEKHKKLGNVGDIANVKNGFARNFLIPNKKAIQATKENREIFKQRKEIIYKEIEKKKVHAEKINSKLENKWIYIVKQAGKDGRLYGSVNSLDIIQAIKEQLKQELQKNNVQLLMPIKYIGRHSVSINVFADISIKVNIVVSRTPEEAEIDLKNAIAGKPEAGKLEENKTKTKAKTEDEVLKEEVELLEESLESEDDGKEPQMASSKSEEETTPKKAAPESEVETKTDKKSE